MSSFIRKAFVLSFFLAGCASSGQVHVRTPQAVELEIPSGGETEVWAQAIAEVSAQVPEYQLVSVDNGRDVSLLDHLMPVGSDAHICLKQRIEMDHAGNLMSIIPVFCTELSGETPVLSLISALDAAQARKMSVLGGGTAEWRTKVLELSTPQDPLCYSIYPTLFAVDEAKLSAPLEEAYLMACADKIEDLGAEDWKSKVSAQLATWLRVEAALLSTQNQFIARVFKAIAADNTVEGMVYGLAIEAYNEFLMQKKRQAEITVLSALQKSDASEFWMLSRQNAMRLSYIAELADTMDGHRLEQIVRALAPQKGWPASIVDFRLWLQIKVCQEAMFIPGISPSFPEACMPWLESSISNKDDLETALWLVEQGMYGAEESEPALTEAVVSWFKRIPWTEVTAPVLREHSRRFMVHKLLSDEHRAMFKELWERPMPEGVEPLAPYISSEPGAPFSD